MIVGITYHEKFSLYDLGLNHPFRGDRFAKARDFLLKQGLNRLPNVKFIKPDMAKWSDIITVHTSKYVDLIFKLAESNKSYDFETPVSASILEGLMYIIGGSISSGRSIYEGSVDRAVNLGGGFHHAGRDFGGGFCIFNDIAILAETLRRNYNAEKILILDFDVHFGDGTSAIFYSDPKVLYISIHQDPKTIFPGTGFIEQIGEGEGEGYNVNIPLPPRTGEDAYLLALKSILIPLSEEFKPDIIIANGGSDAHFADHLGSLGLTVNGFFEVSKILSRCSNRICNGRLILLLGSGYNLTVLPYCWYALIKGILSDGELDIKDPYPPPENPRRNIEKVKDIIVQIKSLLRDYWGSI